MKRLLIFMVVVLFIAGHASALINVDIQPPGDALFTGVAAAGGGVWNAVEGMGISAPLVDSAGNPTGVTIDIFGAGIVNDLWNANLTDDLTNDYIYAGNPDVGGTGPGTLTIAGLEAGVEYDLYVYSTMSRDSQWIDRPLDTIWTFGAQVKEIEGLWETDLGPWYDAVHQGKSYEIFTLTADGSGQLSGTFSYGADSLELTGGNSFFNGMQLVEVPEPCTIALFGLGTLALIRKRRS